MKIVIADPSEEIQDLLRHALPDTYDITLCSDGVELLDCLEQVQPDLLVLDVMLPVLDGIYILQNLFLADKMPKVLVLSRFVSEYAVAALEIFGVTDVIQIPCSIPCISSRIMDILSRSDESSHFDVRRSVTQILLSLGLRVNLCGYKYLLEAIVEFRKDTDQLLVKELYPKVAELCGGSWQQAERAIRLSIQDAWRRRDERIWRLYFGTDSHGKVPKVSNSEFISVIARCCETSADLLPDLYGNAI